jgi:hypothetical protein
MAAAWQTEPAILVVLRKLHELSLRSARIELAQQMRRTSAMLAALGPKAHAPPGSSDGAK